MKKIHLITILALFFSMAVTAQNYGRNDNRQYSANDKLEMERRKDDFDRRKAENVEKSIEKLKTDLQLDALQEIAVRQIIAESIRQEGVIMKKEENDEDKMKAMQALSESTDTKITALLNPVQKEKFIEIKTNIKKKRK